jgi:hypothetical protein
MFGKYPKHRLVKRLAFHQNCMIESRRLHKATLVSGSICGSKTRLTAREENIVIP